MKYNVEITLFGHTFNLTDVEAVNEINAKVIAKNTIERNLKINVKRQDYDFIKEMNKIMKNG